MEKVTFDKLSPGYQKSLKALMVTRYIYKGIAEPEREVTKTLAKRKKSLKAWRYMRFACMQSIDTYRLRLGLEPLYNVL